MKVSMSFDGNAAGSLEIEIGDPTRLKFLSVARALWKTHEASARAMVTDQLFFWLTDVGTNKIQVIKAIREFTGLGLKEAKDIADACQANGNGMCRVDVIDVASMERGMRLIRDAGGKVSLRKPRRAK